VAHNELSMQLEYINLQIKALDMKVFIPSMKTAGLSFNDLDDENPKVSGHNVSSPHV
jgi:hypothetical protein